MKQFHDELTREEMARLKALKAIAGGLLLRYSTTLAYSMMTYFESPDQYSVRSSRTPAQYKIYLHFLCIS